MARLRIPSPPRRTLFIALALVCALVAGFAAGAVTRGGARAPELVGRGATAADLATAAADEAKSGAPTASTDGGAPESAGWTAGGPRRLVQSADLGIVLRRGELEGTVVRVRAYAARLGGYVLSSSVGDGRPLPGPLTPAEAPELVAPGMTTREDTRPTRAWLTLRVPAARADEALAWFGRLGEVRRVTTATDDVTRQWVDLQARLRHFRAVERRLLRFLAETRTVKEMLAVQDRIDQVQLTIEQLTAEITSLRETTDYATFTLELVERDAPQAGAIDQSDTFAGTFAHSLRLLARSIRLAALAVTAAAPFALAALALGGGVWWGWRRGGGGGGGPAAASPPSPASRPDRPCRGRGRR